MNVVLRRRHRRLWPFVALIVLVGGMLAWRDQRGRTADLTAAGRHAQALAPLLDGVP